MNLLTTVNLLSRLYHGQGLKSDELLRLESALEEQLKYVKELREKFGKAGNDA